MFEIFISIMFCWFFICALRLMFKVTWRLTKVFATILFILSIPSLICCLIYVGGASLFLPVAMITGAWALLRVHT